MTAVVGVLAAAALLMGCSDGTESKVKACEAWDTAEQATQAWEDHLNEVLGAGDAPGPADEELRDLSHASEQAGAEAKAAFARAADEDPAWGDVQEAAYKYYSDPTDGEARITVEAACDRVES